jgi:hypothetical protein
LFENGCFSQSLRLPLRKRKKIQKMLWGTSMKMALPRLSCIALLFAAVFVVLMSSSPLKASPLPSEADRPFFERIKEQARTGVHGPFGDHYYWEDGFHLVSPKKRVRIGLDGRLMVDGGYIGADKALQDAFPDLEGGEGSFRDLKVVHFFNHESHPG